MTPQESAAYRAEQLRLREKTPNHYVGDCPFCERRGAFSVFGLQEIVGSDCSACGWSEMDGFVDLDAALAPKPVSTFLSVTDLENRPPPEPQIDGVLPLGSLAAVYGKPGTGKSFVALAWTMSVGYGQAWAHRAVKPGRVLYVSAEGASGLGRRISAWRRFHDCSERIPPVHFVLEPVELMDRGAVRQFVADVKSTFGEEDLPSLVVFDTLARCLIGGDENSARDMGLAIAGADIVRHELDCTVLLIHHSNKSGESERGSTALRGAVDVLMSLTNDDAGITLKCEKAKDDEPFGDIALALTQHEDSAVITPNEGVKVIGYQLSAHEVTTLKSLSRSALEDGLATTKWEELTDVSSSSFYRARKALYDRGFVDRAQRGRSYRYTVSEKGEQALAVITPNYSQGVGSNPTQPLPPKAPPFRGAGSGSKAGSESAEGAA